MARIEINLGSRGFQPRSVSAMPTVAASISIVHPMILVNAISFEAKYNDSEN